MIKNNQLAKIEIELNTGQTLEYHVLCNNTSTETYIIQRARTKFKLEFQDDKGIDLESATYKIIERKNLIY